MLRNVGFAGEWRGFGKVGGDDGGVVHIGGEAAGRLLITVLGEGAHVSRNQDSGDHRTSCRSKEPSLTRWACSRMPAFTRSASSRARSASAPFTSGARRVRMACKKARNSDFNGSSGVVGTFTKLIGCCGFWRA